MTKYQLTKAINNSSLTYLNPTQGGSPALFKNYLDGYLDSPENEFMLKGIILHKLFLEPDKFILENIAKAPTPKIKSVIDLLINTNSYGYETDLNNLKIELLECANIVEYQTNWGVKTRIKRIIEEGNEYFKYVLQNVGKIILSDKDYATVLNIKENMFLHPFIKKHFIDRTFDNGIELLTEQELFWDEPINGTIVKCKGKVDAFLLNHNNKTFSVFDYKTTTIPIHEFPKAFKDRHMSRQIAFYTSGIEKTYGYKPKSFYIIYAYTKPGYDVILWEIDTQYIKLGIAEYKDLLYRYNIHLTTANWLYSLEFIKTSGIFPLKPSKII